MIDARAVLERDHEPARLATIDDLPTILDATRVHGMNHRELEPIHLLGTPFVHG